MKHILILLALSMTHAAAHPGHPGHEDWPFDDFSWSLTATLLGGLLIVGWIMAKHTKAD